MTTKTSKAYEVVRLSDATMGAGQGGWYVKSMTKDDTTAGLWRLGSYAGPYPTHGAADRAAAQKRAENKSA